MTEEEIKQMLRASLITGIGAQMDMIKHRTNVLKAEVKLNELRMEELKKELDEV